MSDADLARLEREVEDARSKLAIDLATLRSPSTFSDFTDRLKYEAVETKNAWVENAKSSAQSKVQGIIDDIKAKAANNPAAALAIGAGIAWRLIQHPPVATALIGAGLFSLLRTEPLRTKPSDDAEYVAVAKRRLAEQADVVSGKVREQAQELAGVAREHAAELSESAKGAVQQWSSKAEDALEHAKSSIAHAASNLADQTSRRLEVARGQSAQYTAQLTQGLRSGSSAVQTRLADDDVRDKLLLGVAGLAVAAALGIAIQRRQDDEIASR